MNNYNEYVKHRELSDAEGGYTVENSSDFSEMLVKNDIFLLLSKHKNITIQEIVNITKRDEQFVKQEINRLKSKGILL